MVEGIMCIQPWLNSQMLITATSKYISAAGKQGVVNTACQNANHQCICNKLYRGYALSEQVRKMVDGIVCIQPRFDSQMLVAVACEYTSAAHKQVVAYSAQKR